MYNGMASSAVLYQPFKIVDQLKFWFLQTLTSTNFV